MVNTPGGPTGSDRRSPRSAGGGEDAPVGPRRIALLDTAVASNNIGDRIIMEAVRHELADLFSSPMVFSATVATHQPLAAQNRELLSQYECSIVGGTNLLSSRMWFRPLWKVSPLDAAYVTNAVLMGAGWYQYQHAPDPYSRWLLRRLLSRDHLHSVRESYALKMLAAIGITNVVNTGCPSIWSLQPAGCSRLPKHRAKAVLTAINSYPGLRNPDADRRMIDILKRRYDDVHLWIQTDGDFDYARSFGSDVGFVDPSLTAFDAMLSSDLDLDYVGVRLHAGIRALQKGRRAIILEIDNRAREMGRDFGLPTVARTDFERLESMIEGPLEIEVIPPRNEIARWKRQFGLHPARDEEPATDVLLEARAKPSH